MRFSSSATGSPWRQRRLRVLAVLPRRASLRGRGWSLRGWARSFRGRGRGGFTLLELVVILALAGLIAGLTIAAVGRVSGAAADRRTIGEISAWVSSARVEAMRSSDDVDVEVRGTDDGLRGTAGGRTASWRTALRPVDAASGPIAAHEASFAPSGRTRARLWRFMASADGDTIWTVAFDPVSGAPTIGDPP